MSQEVEHPALPTTAREWYNVPSAIAQLPVSGVISDTSSMQEGLPALKYHVMIPAAISARAHQQALATARNTLGSNSQLAAVPSQVGAATTVVEEEAETEASQEVEVDAAPAGKSNYMGLSFMGATLFD